jgi:hypothetical protein
MKAGSTAWRRKAAGPRTCATGTARASSARRGFHETQGLAAAEKVADERKAAGDRQQQTLLQYLGAGTGAVAVAPRPDALLADQHRGVFGEIHTAFVAASAVPLRCGTRGALIEQRGVAARAELHGVGVLRLALGTFHGSILPRPG